MTISDHQYNECCAHINKMFENLIIESIRGNRDYLIMLNSALIGERMFIPFKQIFQSASYSNDVTSVRFSFKNISEDSPLVSIEGLEAAYNDIPRKLGRYITPDYPEISNYEREHLNDCLKQAAIQIQEIDVNAIKEMIQQTLDEYQSSFHHCSTYNEKNNVLLKMNQLYTTVRNPSKLIKFVEEKLHISHKVNSKPEESKLYVSRRQLFKTFEEKTPIKPVAQKSQIKIAVISLSSLFGILSGFGLLLWVTLSHNESNRIFFNLNSLLFVLGGTFACTMVSYHGLYIGRALKEILQIFIPTHVSPSLLLHDVETVLEWSHTVRRYQQQKKPFRQLEEQFSRYEDPDTVFTQTAIGFLLSNYSSEKLASILNTLVNTMFDRSQIQVQIIRTMGNIAAIFGIIGSLIRIIILLSSPYHQLGDFMNSVASSLIPMLYGLILAYLVFKPAARKLEQKNEMRRFRNQLLSRGFVLLQDNCSTLEIQDNLNSFLDQERHVHVAPKPKES